MARPLPRLQAIPPDHKVPVLTWTLFNRVNLDSVVEERTFVAGSSIVVRVQNIGEFVKITISDGVGEASELMASGQVLIIQTGGLGERIPYRIKVKAENKNIGPRLGAALSVFVVVLTVAPTRPIPPFPRSPTVVPPPPAPPTPERFHTVKPNEYLRKIAEIYYHDPNKWKVIYDANKTIIGPNPNLIFAGQKLRIPF